MDFYVNMAEGGCGLIFTGCAVVMGDDLAFDRVMRLDMDDQIPSLKKLFVALKKRGTVPAIQLVHYGRQTSSSLLGHVLLAPSAIPCPVMSTYDPKYEVREMTLEDIQTMREAFIAAAQRAVTAGAEVVEIHGAHGYLLNQFLSPYSNKRTDMYGGSVENRARLLVEIVQGVRQQIGKTAAISVRVSGDEFVEGGMRPPDFKEIVPMLEAAGMDLLNVSAGVYASMDRITPPMSLGDMPHVSITQQLKAFAHVPVCAVGSIFSIEMAESILARGIADVIAMGRAQTADPAIVKKSFEGHLSDINSCTQCNSCTFWTTGDPEMYCTVNPDYKKP